LEVFCTLDAGERKSGVLFNNAVGFFPFTGLGRPLGLQEVRLSEILDSRHVKVVRTLLIVTVM